MAWTHQRAHVGEVEARRGQVEGIVGRHGARDGHAVGDEARAVERRQRVEEGEVHERVAERKGGREVEHVEEARVGLARRRLEAHDEGGDLQRGGGGEASGRRSAGPPASSASPPPPHDEDHAQDVEDEHGVLREAVRLKGVRDGVGEGRAAGGGQRGGRGQGSSRLFPGSPHLDQP